MEDRTFQPPVPGAFARRDRGATVGRSDPGKKRAGWVENLVLDAQAGEIVDVARMGDQRTVKPKPFERIAKAHRE